MANTKREAEKIATQLFNALILLSNVADRQKYEACVIVAERLEKEWPSLAPIAHAMSNNLYRGE